MVQLVGREFSYGPGRLQGPHQIRSGSPGVEEVNGKPGFCSVVISLGRRLLWGFASLQGDLLVTPCMPRHLYFSFCWCSPRASLSASWTYWFKSACFCATPAAHDCTSCSWVNRRTRSLTHSVNPSPSEKKNPSFSIGTGCCSASHSNCYPAAPLFYWLV